MIVQDKHFDKALAYLKRQAVPVYLLSKDLESLGKSSGQAAENASWFYTLAWGNKLKFGITSDLSTRIKSYCSYQEWDKNSKRWQKALPTVLALFRTDKAWFLENRLKQKYGTEWPQTTPLELVNEVVAFGFEKQENMFLSTLWERKKSNITYTKTPNRLFEIMPALSESALRVYLVIVRQTRGYHKQGDYISLSRFVSNTGLSKQGVLNGIAELIEMGVVSKKGSIYALSSGQSIGPSGSTTLTLAGPHSGHTKETSLNKLKEDTSYLPKDATVVALHGGSMKESEEAQKKWLEKKEAKEPETMVVKITQLYVWWDRLVVKYHASKFAGIKKPLSGGEKVWLSTFFKIEEIGEEHAYGVMRWAIRNWSDFVLEVQACSQDKLAQLPQPGALAKHWDLALKGYKDSLKMAKPKEGEVLKFTKKQGFTPSGN